MRIITVLHTNVKKYDTKFYITSCRCNPVTFVLISLKKLYFLDQFLGAHIEHVPIVYIKRNTISCKHNNGQTFIL